MIKNIVLISMVVSACAFTAQAEIPVSFHCDFNNGIPDNIKLIDNDRNEPSPDIVSQGFAIGTPWIDVRTDDAHVRSAASTSWYKSAAQSDDWMILPKVKIVSPVVKFAWEARAHDNVLSDGYEVYVSESGDGVEDFRKLKPFFSCATENAEWTSHSLSLADYAGKEVNIAFVNNSTDKAILYIDNITIEETQTLSLAGFVPALLTVGEPLALKGTVTNNTDTDTKGINIVFKIGGREFRKNDPSANIPAHGMLEINMDTDFAGNSMESWPYTLEVASGEYSVSKEGMLMSARQNVLLEEGTGTWCMWCPRGAVAIEKLKVKYPDTFIPVAVHANDPMYVKGYSIYTSSGYPVCVANRIDRLRGDPKNMEDYYLDAAGRKPIAALTSAGEYKKDDGKISLHTEAAFSKDYQEARFSLQYIVIENNVHSEDAMYNQKNAYSGGTEEMGGFENLPDPVPAAQMWYQDVARMLVGTDSGIEESIPDYIAAGNLISHDYEFVLTDNIMNQDEIKVIAAIVDTKSGEVVNSAYAAVKGFSSVHDIDYINNVYIKREGNILRVVTDSDIESVALATLNGTVYDSSDKEYVDLSGYEQGIYIVHIKSDGKLHYFKLAI